MSTLFFDVFAKRKVTCYSRRQKKVRELFDKIYRYLQHLCALLEDKDYNEVQDQNPHSISIDELNQFLQGVKELFS